MKKKNNSNFLVFLLFAAGFLILFYPAFSDGWNTYRNQQLKSEYTQSVTAADRETLEQEWEAANQYNRSLIGTAVPDAFALREEYSDPVYEGILNVNGDGMMGYVEIPSIDVSLPVYHYTTEAVLKQGAGHLAGSSLPVGGKSSHAVLSAHRGLPSAKMFTDLNLLEEGDRFRVHVLDQALTYEVDQVKVVAPDQTEDLAVERGKDLVTLLTCTPYGVNTERLLVRGHRITEKEEKNGSDLTHKYHKILKNPSLIMEILCVLCGILLALFLTGFLEWKRKR